MKKVLFAAIFVIIIVFVLSPCVGAGKVYEYSLSEKSDSRARDAVEEFAEGLPDEIKNALPEGEDKHSFDEYDFGFFVNLIKKEIKDSIEPCIKSVSVLLGLVIVSAAFNIFATALTSDKIKEAFSFCSSLCIALCIFETMKTVFGVVEAMLETLSDTMLAMIPAMEAIYIFTGNLTSSTVCTTGINLMIGFTQTVFSKILWPWVYTVFILCVAGSVSKNNGIAFMVRMLKGIITGVLIAVMTLMTFVLALQTGGASAVDNLYTKTIKFAIGNYLPIVGGSLAESFSMLSGSLGVIKEGCGLLGIAVIIIAFAGPFFILLANRLAVGISAAAAGILSCERESLLLEECKGICTMLLAVCSSAAVMYIIALGIFARTPMAIS